MDNIAEETKDINIDNSNNNHKMSQRHLSFCLEYISNGGNATKAYMSVYNSKCENTAGVQGYRLLKKTYISQYINTKLQEVVIKPADDKYKALEVYLWSIVRGIKTRNATVGVRASELLMKLYGYGKEIIEVNNTNPLDLLNDSGTDNAVN